MYTVLCWAVFNISTYPGHVKQMHMASCELMHAWLKRIGQLRTWGHICDRIWENVHSSHIRF